MASRNDEIAEPYDPIGDKMIVDAQGLRRTVLAGLCLAVLLVAGSGRAQDKTVLEWRFDKAGDFRGWQPNGEVADARVRGGSLHGRATGGDPILLGPVFRIPAEPAQCVEICMKGTAKAMAELFWTETQQGRYGGFNESKHRAFHTQGDGKYHVYRIWPFGTPPSRSSVCGSIRPTPENSTSAGSALPKAKRPAPRWPNRGIGRRSATLASLRQRRRTILRTDPAQSADLDSRRGELLRLRAHEHQPSRQRASILRFANGHRLGEHHVSTRPDGKPHSYNLATSTLKNWRGEILFLGLEVSTAAQARDARRIDRSRPPAARAGRVRRGLFRPL